MQNRKPYRTAVEGALAIMRLRYDTMLPPVLPQDGYSRALTLPLTEIIMRQLADAQDAGESIEDFAQGFTHALGNVIASVASNLTGHQNPAMTEVVTALSQAAIARALMRAQETGADGVPVYAPREGA